jgi:replication-associated recombination protein RarA
LISGPPGLGKTTLAHIIAKRAGYNFIEMNARYVFIRKIILRIMFKIKLILKVTIEVLKLLNKILSQ